MHAPTLTSILVRQVLDLCDRLQIYPDVQVSRVEMLNEILTKLDGSNEAGTRYVLDIRGSLDSGAKERCTAPPPTLKPDEGGLTTMAVVREIAFLKFGLRGPRGKWR